MAASAALITYGLHPIAWIAPLAFIVGGFAVLFWLPLTLTGEVELSEGFLRVKGVPPYNSFNRRNSAVNLHSLARLYGVMVSQHGTAVPTSRLASYLALEDTLGGRQRLPLRWWSNVEVIKSAIKEGVLISGPEMDERAHRWLG
jgi:hypothetical protein